jgi:hypothetical protein
MGHRWRGLQRNIVNPGELWNREVLKDLFRSHLQPTFSGNQTGYSRAGSGLVGNACDYSTVTDFARLRGWSTSVPMNTAVK